MRERDVLETLEAVDKYLQQLSRNRAIQLTIEKRLREKLTHAKAVLG